MVDMEGHMTTDKMALAMAAAREFKMLRDRGESSVSGKCAGLRRDIEGWVGRWSDGKFVLPEIVRKEMGLRDGA